MFNYHAANNAFTILRAMHGEKVPARSVYVPAEMDNLYSGLNCNQIKVANLTPLPSGKSLYEHFLQFAWERVVDMKFRVLLDISFALDAFLFGALIVHIKHWLTVEVITEARSGW